MLNGFHILLSAPGVLEDDLNTKAPPSGRDWSGKDPIDGLGDTIGGDACVGLWQSSILIQEGGESMCKKEGDHYCEVGHVVADIGWDLGHQHEGNPGIAASTWQGYSHPDASSA